MAQVLKMVNGFPEMVTVDTYDDSLYYASGLAADSTITLPNSGSFTDSSAGDIIIIGNKKVWEVARDFTVVGVGPTYTQIKNVWALPDDFVLHFKQGII
jgi:hypothetical protein